MPGKREVARVRTRLRRAHDHARASSTGRGFLTVLGGFLLVLPGFLTDMLGALLLLPLTQRWIRAALRRAVARAERASGPARGGRSRPDQWRRVPEERIAPQAICRHGLRNSASLSPPERLC